ncbi:MAG: hypothetical protein IIY70_02870, partial [Oscillospiraceae bacterium]|nr:hypothetical protein [Oscillospiraceae bacterium]
MRFDFLLLIVFFCAIMKNTGFIRIHNAAWSRREGLTTYGTNRRFMQEEFLNFKIIVQHNAPVYLQGGGIAEKPWVVGPPAELKQILTFEAKGFRLPAALRQL